MALFLAHTIILLAASHGAARSLLRHSVDRLLATAMLAWGNLVFTSLLLASLHHLGGPAWFFRSSLAIALVTWWLVRRINPEPVPVETGGGPSPGELILFFATLAPIAYA